MTLSRRTFLAGGAGMAAAGALAAYETLQTTGPTASPTAAPDRRPADSVLNRPAAECPVDTVVVVMMENRSFDHYLGWLADDPAYLELGRRHHGPDFHVDGRVNQRYADGFGRHRSTKQAGTYTIEKVESRGCDFRDPGHSWIQSRIQRDHGFLAPLSGNDEFALTYYTDRQLPVYAALARRFTVFDQWHASLLGPTFPNRQYLLSAQSEGMHSNPKLAKDAVSLRQGYYRAETILERLARAGVTATYYYTRVPLVALWGTDRMAPFIRPLDQYFQDAATGRLPKVVFLEPQFGGGDAYRTDDHPRGDVGLGQRWVREVFRAFAASPQWGRGAFILTYDESGGFFDHVRPPQFADARASRIDLRNFGQGGFRVPALLASPYAMEGGVDHRRYDHTSILRFLEWRFLGAPPEGPGGGSWALSERDRAALNMGATLRASRPNPSLGFDIDLAIPPAEPGCTPAQLAAHPPNPTSDPFDSPELNDFFVSAYAPSTHRPWLADVPAAL